MNLLLRTRLHLLRSSLPLFLTTPFASISTHRLFLSTAATEAPPPKPNFSAVDYLVQSCGLSSQEALRASNKTHHLKSPAKPDAVLRFLRATGISESDVRTAVLREPRILCSGVETNWRPNLMKLQEVGFSIEDISALISRHPTLFLFNFVSKIDFWMRALGSKNLSVVLRRGPRLLNCRLQKVGLNLSFLKEQMGFDVHQIPYMIKQAPYLFTSSPEALMIKAKQAEELGVSRSSRNFACALAVVSNLNQKLIQSRVNNLKRHGFSGEEVITIVSKQPTVLTLQEELVACKVEFLLKEVGCDKEHVIHNPVLLCLSLNKRLIPRNLVRKLLELKGFPVAKRKFCTFAVPSEEQFVKRFVLPYEHAIPGLHQACVETCAGNVRGIEWFKNMSS